MMNEILVGDCHQCGRAARARKISYLACFWLRLITIHRQDPLA